MRLWTFGIAVGLLVSIGCVGGPGDGFGEVKEGDLNSGFGTGGTSNTGGREGSSTSSSSSSSSSGSSGTTVNTQLKASDFNQTCSTAADCFVVFQGDACNPCPCPNAAIARSAADDYASKSTSARVSCPPSNFTGDCAACPNSVAACSGGKCAAAVGVVTDGG